MSECMNDPVNHPAHYTDGKYEVIDFVETFGLGFHLGNAIKYICRAGKKDPSKDIEDLEKAVWYLERAISTDMQCPLRSFVANGKKEKIGAHSFCSDKKLPLPLEYAVIGIAFGNSVDSIKDVAETIKEYIEEKEEATNE